MVYISNTYLNPKSKVRQSLRNIYGIGKSLGDKVSDTLGLSEQVLVSQLKHSEISKISQIIGKEFLTGTRLRLSVRTKKDRNRKIGCYKGIRQSLGLPLNGQRTHGNAKTARKLKNKI